jgi:hypothetical protein
VLPVGTITVCLVPIRRVVEIPIGETYKLQSSTVLQMNFMNSLESVFEKPYN